jgi:hypothetical protein
MITRERLKELYEEKRKAREAQNEASKIREASFDAELDYGLKSRFSEKADARYRAALDYYITKEAGPAQSSFDEIPF